MRLEYIEFTPDHAGSSDTAGHRCHTLRAMFLYCE